MISGTGTGDAREQPVATLLVRLDNCLALRSTCAPPSAIARMILQQMRVMLGRDVIGTRLSVQTDLSVEMELRTPAPKLAELAERACMLCEAIAFEGVTFEGVHVHPALSIKRPAPAEPAQDERRRDAAGRALRAEDLSIWPLFDESPVQFRKDMDAAASLFAAVRQDRLFLAWQPIGNPDDELVLYRETLCRIISPDGEPRACGDLIAAAERVGLAPVFDRIVMASVLRELAASPAARLAVNLSASSVHYDYAWEPLIAAIEKDRGVASRLVVEITETAPFRSFKSAFDFIRRLRRAGCQIAVDDFGAGNSSLRRLLLLQPDIIKIDGLFIRLAAAPRAPTADAAHRPHTSYAMLLRQLVSLSVTLAPVTVVEGVETIRQAELARDLGARWMQGYQIGLPSMAGGRRAVAPPETGAAAGAGRDYAAS